MKGVRGRGLCPPWQRLPGLEFPELLAVPACLGKLTRLASASEVALGWWTNTESSALPQSSFMPGLPSPSHSPGCSEGCRSCRGCFGQAQPWAGQQWAKGSSGAVALPELPPEQPQLRRF